MHREAAWLSTFPFHWRGSQAQFFCFAGVAKRHEPLLKWDAEERFHGDGLAV